MRTSFVSVARSAFATGGGGNACEASPRGSRVVRSYAAREAIADLERTKQDTGTKLPSFRRQSSLPCRVKAR